VGRAVSVVKAETKPPYLFKTFPFTDQHQILSDRLHATDA
jgi:hypothetical protein